MLKTMIRNVQVPMNGYLYSHLRLAAKLDGLDCAETLIELWLGERLAQRPEISDLAARLAKAKKDVTAQWEAEQADKREQLPCEHDGARSTTVRISDDAT